MGGRLKTSDRLTGEEWEKKGQERDWKWVVPLVKRTEGARGCLWNWKKETVASHLKGEKSVEARGRGNGEPRKTSSSGAMAKPWRQGHLETQYGFLMRKER